MWFRKSWKDGAPLQRWAGWHDRRGPAEALDPVWPDMSFTLPTPEEKVTPATTPLYCHCRGVSFLLRSALDQEHSPTEELTTTVNPKTFKYVALTCVCDSCRAACGVDLPNWTFANLKYIVLDKFPGTVTALKEAVASPEKDGRLGTLTFYKSSENVERYYCFKSSTTVFYALAKRPDMVDIAVGLLDHPTGARAEGLLSWDFGQIWKVDSTEGGWREKIAKASLRACEEWRVVRGYPRRWSSSVTVARSA
ncbi:hypothetical protein jhhlp_004878 [Lomentospora prolificans]|uniref:CENP-V/GFA domain-containing protein n=1 Tax=Lomentospora prolificans TaxID=41688 RepID=A0A2N3N7X4_9PEZI|nr:hypothetical protein jhhlp_004878 [Lomentospora prolificans]